MAKSSPFMPSERGGAPSIAEELQAKARALEAKGEDIVYLQIGQPSTGAPRGTLDVIQETSKNSTLGYAGAGGILPLKERIAQQYQEHYDTEVDPNRIIISFGASGAMILALVGCFDAGQRVGLPQPFYYGYRRAMGSLGVECVPFETSMENHFQPTIEDIEAIDGKIDGLIIASPGNPTGSMVSPDHLRELAEYCEQKGIQFISDEIYHGIVFADDIRQATAATYSKQAIVVNSFSKYYSMAGWRLGWMVVPENLVSPISNLAHNLYLCPPTPSQYGALHAMDCREELDKHVERYRRNRDILIERLPAMDFDRFTAPHGAFYLYCHVEHLAKDSVEFCVDMLEGAGVLVAPGSDFCPKSGKHFIRFSYAGDTQVIEKAMDRLEAWRKKG